MPEFVVDLLEVVDVYDVYSERVFIRGVVYHILQEYLHAAAVVEPRQRVGVYLAVLYFEEGEEYGQECSQRDYRGQREYALKYRSSRRYDDEKER